MEFKYRAIDRRPWEYLLHSPSLSYYSQQAIGAGLVSPNHVRHTRDIGLSPAIDMDVTQMGEQNRSLGAMDSDMRYTPNHISNLEVVPVEERDNPLEDIQYDAMQRQLEKQRIREAIIASEIERRRMLELEVRRELEQEIAMQRAADRFTFQERSSLWFDQRFSFVDRVDNRLMPEPWAFGGHARVDMFPSRHLQPFSEATQLRVNSEDGRSRVIMLAKPTPNLSGSKRKLISSPPEECSQEPPSIRSKKPREEHSCALCKVSATSARGLNDHLKGKKHKLMEEKLRSENLERKKAPNSNFHRGKAIAGSRKGRKEETDKKLIKPASEDQKDCDDTSSVKDEGPKVAPRVEICPKGSNKKGRNFKFWCETCGVGAFSETVFGSHMKGKKHRQHLELKGEAASDTAAAAAGNGAKSGPPPEVN